MNNSRLLCPSARCQEGAILLGTVLAKGTVAFLKERSTIGKTFVEIANEGRTPEKRFRFSSPCLKCGCEQWTGLNCSIVDKCIAKARQHIGAANSMPECSIRAQCRWFFQRGAAAC